jgi:hypothetical protein
MNRAMSGTREHAKMCAARRRRRITVKDIRYRYCNGGWWPTTSELTCSTRPRCAPRATDTREQPYRRPGRPPRDENHPELDGTCGEPGAR